LANFGNKKNAESLVGSAFQRIVFIALKGVISNKLIEDLTHILIYE
jgi:hypothetical protein